MSETDSIPKGGRLSWWPRLLLWGVVIAFGVVYLGSTKRRADEAQTSAQAPVAATVDAPAIARPSEASPTAAEGVGGAGETTRPRVPASDAAPVQAAESAAFARSLMQAEPSQGMATESAADLVSAPAAPALSTPPARAPAADRALASDQPPSVVAPTAAAPAQDVRPDGPPSDPMGAEQPRVPDEHKAMRPATGGPTYPQWGPPAMPMPYGYPSQGYPPQGYSPQGYPRQVPGAYPPR
jgi:hypothetical protein